METFNLSWSILSSWAFYNKEEAIKAFRKEPITRSPEAQKKLDEGSAIHKEIEDSGIMYIPGLTGKGEKELYGKVALAPWLNFSYKVDYYEEPIAVDYKTGKRKTEESAREQMALQGYCYALMLEMIDKPVDQFNLVYVKKTKKDGITLSDEPDTFNIGSKELQMAADFIFDTASEFKRFYLSQYKNE